TDPKKSDLIVDDLCFGEPDGKCTLNSGDHRKVTSHVFGRNKRETYQIPEELWIKYCRKHYQRQKYRCPQDWYETQLLLVDSQLTRLEEWGGVIDWTIQLRKKEREYVDKENNYQAIHGSLPDGVLTRERFLLQHLGPNKTFAEVREVVDLINKECDDTGIKFLPSFEFLPRIDERRNPRPRRGVGRRGMRRSVPRTPTAPSTFRLATDDSGKLTQIETKPRQNSGTGYALAKQLTQAKKRSASAMNGDKTPEPSARLVKKQKKSGFRAVNKQTPPPSDDDDKDVVDTEVQRLAKRPVASSSVGTKKDVVNVSNTVPRLVERPMAPSSNDKKKGDVKVSNAMPLPVKRPVASSSSDNKNKDSVIVRNALPRPIKRHRRRWSI
ncbi:MAG: hypothetical protein Q9169_008322, partial [Polycauliona sp. 2 TL-2023]